MDLRPLIFALLLSHAVPFISAKTDGICTSQGGRFLPFASHGKSPKRVNRGSKDLTLCRVFRKETCCDVAQTHPALLNIRKLASTGEATQECLQLWELLECSICDPRVGVRRGPPMICVSFCDRVFEACSDAYFAMEPMTQILTPCGVNDFVCGKVSHWVRNGTELCRSSGFSVTEDLRLEETSCYGGQASLDSIADSWKSPRREAPRDYGTSSGVLDDFQQWAMDMRFSERVSWAVGGMVLTAGLLYISKRKSHSHRQKLAAIQRTATARRMEMKMTPNYAR